jgi:hypothetical protein
VSDAIRKKLNKVDGYEIGELLICRNYININTGNHKCQVNLKLQIVKIEGDFYMRKSNNRIRAKFR